MNTRQTYNEEEEKGKGEHTKENRKRSKGRDDFVHVDAESLQMEMIKKEGDIDKLQGQINQIKEEIKSLHSQNATLNTFIRRLQHKNEALQHRSEKITKEIALKMDDSGCFEDAGEFSGYNITLRLQVLYDHNWTSLYRNVGKQLPDLQERDRITLLSDLLKYCYDECNKVGDMQLRQFLLLSDKESLPNNKEFQGLLSARKKICREKSFREKVTKTVLEKMYESSKVLDKYKTISVIKKELDDFYTQFTDCCWLVVISNPPIVLNFDVVGKPFEELKLGWTEFASKQAVEDMDREEGTVAVVVWPSVALRDESGLYKKGDVLVVQKGKAVARKTENNEPSKATLSKQITQV